MRKYKGEMVETKIYLKWRDNYFNQLYEEVHSEESEDNDIKEAIELNKAEEKAETDDYNESGICMLCERTTKIDPETCNCSICDDIDDWKEYVPIHYPDFEMDSKQLAKWIADNSDFTIDELRQNARTMKKDSDWNAIESLLWIAECNGLDPRKPIEKSKEIEAENQNAEAESLQKDEILNATITKMAERIKFLYKLMSDKMEFIEDVEITDKEIQEITEIKELVKND